MPSATTFGNGVPQCRARPMPAVLPNIEAHVGTGPPKMAFDLQTHITMLWVQHVVGAETPGSFQPVIEIVDGDRPAPRRPVCRAASSAGPPRLAQGPRRSHQLQPTDQQTIQRDGAQADEDVSVHMLVLRERVGEQGSRTRRHCDFRGGTQRINRVRDDGHGDEQYPPPSTRSLPRQLQKLERHPRSDR